MKRTNILGNSAKPLFFRVNTTADSAFEPAADRLDESVRAHVRSLSIMQKEALVISRRTGAVWRLASDEGAYLDGDDEAPCPLSFLTTGMVSSYMEEILALAKQQDVEIRNIRLIQDNYYSMQGSALKGTMTGGAKDVELEVQIESDADKEQIAQLVYNATAASPLNGLMRHCHESLFSLTHNSNSVACGDVAAVEGPVAFPLSDDVFEAAEPAKGDWSGLIIRNGLTPETDEATSYAGSSLAEHQDRILHVRGICTLQPDGVKRIEQHLYNPHGSIFHFLSDEAPISGGQGLAPDAATYISAGIAFCFMTQLGRYAKIAKQDLDYYAIVQDTFFSLGGASGATGRAGAADPVETHVSLVTKADDEFARTALDMSEQTCFLHALCRTELRTKVKIRNFG